MLGKYPLLIVLDLIDIIYLTYYEFNPSYYQPEELTTLLRVILEVFGIAYVQINC